MIYADFNATTPLGLGAELQMKKALEHWGNPSSSHRIGRQATELIDFSRRQVAEKVGVSASEIVFTSGGSEANTMALLGSYWMNPADFRLLTSKVEHSSLRDTTELLEKLGAKVSYVALEPSGALDLEKFKQQLHEIRPNLVSLMTANNETGVVFPVAEIAELCHEAGAVFHTDAIQAFGKLDSSLWNKADLISISAHKVFGPKGIGALVVRRGQKLIATHYGGAQEIKRRGGTENTLGAAGFGGACSELPHEAHWKELEILRDTFETKLQAALPDLTIQGKTTGRVPNTSNVRFPGIPAEVMLSALDLEGVCVSAGSACSSGSVQPSHVLLEMGLSKVEAKECVRFSWGKTTTSADIDMVATLVISHVNRIRNRRGNRT